MTRRAGKETGAIGALTALTLTFLLGLGALSVDLGLLYTRQRALQAAVDVAALESARLLGDNPRNAGSAQWYSAAQALSVSAVEQQGFAGVAPELTFGYYKADREIPAASRFQPSGASAAPGSATGSPAVKVAAQSTVPLGLMRIFGVSTGELSAQATATYQPYAGFTLGSGTVDVRSGLLNALLGGPPGGETSLSAIDYNGLLHAQVNAFSFLDGLAAQLRLTSGTYDTLLNTEVSVDRLLSVAATALTTASATASSARADLLSLAAIASSNRTIRLGKLLNLGIANERTVGSLAGSAYTTATLNALDLVTAIASLGGANAGAATIALPSIQGSTVAVTVSLVEPPVTAGQSQGYGAIGPVGIRASTAQVRLKIDLGLPVLLLDTKVSVIVEVAPATATLTQISCPNDPGRAGFTVSAQPGLASASINSAVTLKFGLLGDLGVLIKAHTAVTPGPSPLTFTWEDMSPPRSSPRTRRTSTTSGAGALGQSLKATGVSVALDASSLAIVGSLLGSVVNLVVNPVLSALLSTLGNILSPPPPAKGLDELVINPLLSTLGISAGYADVTPTGVRCGVPVLVS